MDDSSRLQPLAATRTAVRTVRPDNATVLDMIGSFRRQRRASSKVAKGNGHIVLRWRGLVTGGASGIRQAIVEKCLDEGATVAFEVRSEDG
jgi:hypothetical protein